MADVHGTFSLRDVHAQQARARVLFAPRWRKIHALCLALTRLRLAQVAYLLPILQESRVDGCGGVPTHEASRGA